MAKCGVRWCGGRSPGPAQREDDSHDRYNRVFASLVHTRPPVVIHRTDLVGRRERIAVVKSACKITHPRRKIERGFRANPCLSRPTRGIANDRRLSDKSATQSIAPFTPYPAQRNPASCAVVCSRRLASPPSIKHQAFRIIFLDIRRCNEPGRRPAGLLRNKQANRPQNMCFSIPRCAMILLPISSIEVWVVLSEGMFSLRKMWSAMMSSRLQRSSLA